MAALADTAGADAALTAAARTGDHAAYAELFERYHSRIYNYAYGIVNNPDDAGDVAQDAFVKVFQALPRLTGDVDFSAYLYRTAHNVAIDAVKHRNRFAPPDSLDYQAEPSLRADPERVALVVEQQDQTWRAASELSDNHRAILALRELHDLSYQEIADVMGMPRTTVGVLLSRARLKFKEAFRMSSIDTENLVKECRDMLPLLSAYLDEELDASKRARVEEHLEACAFCRLALEEMTEASRSYRALLPLFVPAAFRDSAWANVSGRLVASTSGTADAGGPPRADGPGSAAGPKPLAASATATGPGRAGASPETGGGIRRRGTRALVGVLALAAIVIFGVSVAGGVAALRAYRATSTTATSLPAAAVDADADAGGAPALVADTTSTAPAPSTVAVTASTTASTEADPTTGSSLPTTAGTARTTTTTRSTTTGAPASTSAPAATSTGAPSTTTTSTTSSSTTTTRSTVPVDRDPPPTPSPRSPANGAVVAGNSVKLVWEGVKDPSGVRYRVEIQRFDGSSYVPAVSYSDLTGTAVGHTMTAPFERWRVSAVDGQGNRSKPSAWWTYSKKIELTVTLTILTTTTGLY